MGVSGQFFSTCPVISWSSWRIRCSLRILKFTDAQEMCALNWHNISCILLRVWVFDMCSRWGVHPCLSGHASICPGVWRPEVEIMCFPWSLLVLFFFWDTISHWTWGSSISLGWPTNVVQKSTCLYFLGPGIYRHGCLAHFDMGSGDLRSDPPSMAISPPSPLSHSRLSLDGFLRTVKMLCK